MSLQVWLPLNGHVKNQGILDADIRWSVSPSFIDGKLGKCLSTGRAWMPASTTAKILNNKSLTIAFWIYVNADEGSSSANIFGNTNMSPNNNRKFTLFQYPTCNDFHWSWMNDVANNTFAVGFLYGILPSYKWTHVTVTYQNPNGTIYINGEKVKTFTGVSNSSTFAYDTTLIYNTASQRLNDFRLYDHALSPLEVKQISQGLVCHYKLGGIGNENLIKGNFSCISTKDSYTSNGSVLCKLSADDIIANQGKTLTLSYKVKSNGNYTASSSDYRSNRFGLHGVMQYVNTSGNTVTTYPLADLLSRGKEEGLYYCSWTLPTNISSINSPLAFAVQTSSSGGFARPADDNNETWYLKDIKLEWGNKPTPWCPNPSDALYSTLGYDDGIEYDCSGYGNNGTKVGDIAWSGDSARYSGSYVFNGTNYIKTNYSASIPELSCSFWVKPNSQNGGYSIIASNYNNPSGGFWISVNCEGHGLWFYNGAYVKGNSLLSNDVWYHGVFTYNNGIGKWYLNGELVTTADISSRGTSLTISNLSIGNSYTGTTWNTKFYGNISDFRLYSKCLSAEDVKSLYNVSASIDKTGVLSAYEFVEEG